MNTPFRRVLLALTLILALYAGIWAEFFPRQFYDSFPGFGLHFVSIDGPYNEHLIRDVGAFYLGLGAITLIAMLARTAFAGRIAGVGWGVFGVLHFGYHVLHPEGTMVDFIAAIIALAVSAALGVALSLPSRSHASSSPNSAR